MHIWWKPRSHVLPTRRVKGPLHGFDRQLSSPDKKLQFLGSLAINWLPTIHWVKLRITQQRKKERNKEAGLQEHILLPSGGIKWVWFYFVTSIVNTQVPVFCQCLELCLWWLWVFCWSLKYLSTARDRYSNLTVRRKCWLGPRNKIMRPAGCTFL